MKIVICGNYGAKNIGDEMILEGLITFLKDTYDKAVSITVISASPEETMAKHGVMAVPPMPAGIRSIIKSLISPPAATREAISQSDLFILGGGGLFASQSLKADIIWYLQARHAIKLNKPIAVLGQSLGRPRGLIEKWIVKRLFSNAKVISLRDKGSKDNLECLNLKKFINITPDFAFYVSPSAKYQDQSANITLALRYTNDWPPQLKQQIALMADDLIKDGHKIQFINFQQGAASDEKVHNEILEKMQQKQQAIQINPRSSSDAESHIANSKILIGMRLHALITAIKTETPFLAISYGPKVAQLLKDHNSQNPIINIEAANNTNIAPALKITQSEKYHTEKSQFQQLSSLMKDNFPSNELEIPGR